MNYFIEIISSNKAKNDIDEIVKGMGFLNLTPMHKKANMFSRLYIKVYGIFRILVEVNRGDVLFLQYPMKKFYKMACVFAHFKGAKVMTIIHDLGSFRRHKLTPESENKRLSQTDFIIVHNDRMKQFLIDHGCQKPLYCLDIFDYLSKSISPKRGPVNLPWLILYAGGLGFRRNAFLYELDKYLQNWSLAIYGKGFEADLAVNWKHISYCGFLSPDDFIDKVQGHFGLVWDGHSVDECNGDWGEYLKINNPHKTSFYLRCGIPIIVWKKAAMAPFVEQNGIGLCVNSLTDIDSILSLLTREEYEAMRKNAIVIGQRLGDGYYTKRALNKAIGHFSNIY